MIDSRTDLLPPTQAIAWLAAQGIQTRAQWLVHHQNRPTPAPAIPVNLFAAHGQAFWNAGGWAAIHNHPAHHLAPEKVAALGRRHGVRTPQQWTDVITALTAAGTRPAGLPDDPTAVFPDLFARWGWDGFFALPAHQSFAALAADDGTVNGVLPLREASALAQASGLRTQSEWRAAIRTGRLPIGTPDSPERHYGAAFHAAGGWPAFLGARAVLMTDQWREDAFSDDDAAERFEVLHAAAFPAATGHHLKKPFVDLTAFLTFARSSGVVSQSDWHRRCNTPGFRPPTVPRNPEQVYGPAFAALGGWAGLLRDTAAHDPRTAPFRTLDDTAEWLQAKQVRSAGDFFRRCREPDFRPKDIPSNPALAYGAAFATAGGWAGVLRDGAPPPSRRQSYLPFIEAARLIQATPFNSAAKYYAASKAGRLPPGLPAAPDKVYADQGWRDGGGWAGFLRGADSTNARHRSTRTFTAAAMIAGRPDNADRHPGTDELDRALTLGPINERAAMRQKNQPPSPAATRLAAKAPWKTV